jgi:hypothetical protein
MVDVVQVSPPSEVCGELDSVAVAVAVAVGVTGHAVVEIAMVSVTTRPGQLVTEGAHEVTVYVLVV